MRGRLREGVESYARGNDDGDKSRGEASAISRNF